MSSINPHYTQSYSQPENYRFSHDSVFLARRVFEIVGLDVQADWSVLDLCAGCGIVGMDFLIHLKNEKKRLPAVCDFLELQSEYAPHFEINKSELNIADTKINFLNQNYTTPTPSQYDLILCNPPYFKPDEGTLSPDQFKNRCRFFIDATEDELIEAIASALRPSGRAFVLSRSGIPRNNPRLNAHIIGDIRGTPLVCYIR